VAELYGLGVVVVLSLVSFVVLRKALTTNRIRVRLLLGFVLMALLPAIGISAGSAVVSYYDGRQQAIDRLESVAALKELEIEVWTEALQNDLLIATSEESVSERVSVVLDVARVHQYYDWYNESVRMRLGVLVMESQRLEELCLLDLEGQVVLCTGSDWEASDCRQEAFFREGLRKPYVAVNLSASKLVEGTGEGDITLSRVCENQFIPKYAPFGIAARPVVDQQYETLGVIVGRATLPPLASIFVDRTGLGSTGRAYLVAPEHSTLPANVGNPGAESGAGQGNVSVPGFAGADAVFEQQEGLSGIYRNYGRNYVMGVYRWLPDLHVVLAAEQDLSEAFRPVLFNLAVSAGMALAGVLLAGGASFVIARSITRPLNDLADTAAEIASGDLDRVAPVHGDDVTGSLAKAFNSMTAQLRDSITNLERYVNDRTRELREANKALRRRALQMEISAQVSRQVTSILEIDDLLVRVVTLIRDAFGYSHVRVLLLEGEVLVLRACSTGTGSSSERIPLSMISLNSYAVNTNQAIVSNDVGQDQRFLVDEAMPGIQSELVMPLRIGEQVIGTLDVLSDSKHAFGAEDELVVGNLADQVAIAIENARLYARSRELAVLEERDRLARDLHDSVIQSLYSLNLLAEGWRRTLHSGKRREIEQYFGRVGEIAREALGQMRLLVYELQPANLDEEGLLGALHRRLSAVEQRAGINTRLVAEEPVDLPSPIVDAFFRIAQEALNNATRHSGATQVVVSLDSRDGLVRLQVTDDGKGFDPDSAACKGGMGLLNMRQRAEEIGGSLTIESASNKGATVTATAVYVAPLDGMDAASDQRSRGEDSG
jgi:signal transduction histidine kinase